MLSPPRHLRTLSECLFFFGIYSLQFTLRGLRALALSSISGGREPKIHPKPLHKAKASHVCPHVGCPLWFHCMLLPSTKLGPAGLRPPQNASRSVYNVPATPSAAYAGWRKNGFSLRGFPMLGRAGFHLPLGVWPQERAVLAPLTPFETVTVAYGHTTGNTPEPVRFQKLSPVRPS